MIAGQKTDALAGLAEGDVSEDEAAGSPLAEAERVEMAGYINGKNTIIAALAAFLGLKILTNIVVLLTLASTE